MIKLYFLLFYEFFKTGIFAIGGGYAVIPFLYYIEGKYGWFTSEELTNMIAVSNITPGPIGINMATYTGYSAGGISGSVISTVAIVLAPFVITVYMLKLFDKFRSNPSIESIFKGLRPASCALLASIGIKLLYQLLSSSDFAFVFPQNIDYKALILFTALIIPFSFMKKNPLLAVLAGAFGGIIINNLH